ncbi:coil containing protein [Vibrio phage 1.015.O._10N.222.51.E5]|nr:coil containing protein [Vibrio phage 1.015.O._10N.222.51.E5]AUR83413.1 coil containing protein [Vibrio phage 1.034.O._10N.261.46.B7]AUR83481.1 coil containing protein [Vibrio phage 1.034.X._10N.261.46.B7]AUR90219.1 coil containing protein [Vibrio phage 1.139.A._10N.261.48.C6]AUR90286.1 coil containing protein [Vibrio phage 1.139.B._10N.261.48.C6]AUR95607.1 coil containing protein [Vibrio phage 1.209.O._10N.222.52.B2]
MSSYKAVVIRVDECETGNIHTLVDVTDTLDQAIQIRDELKENYGNSQRTYVCYQDIQGKHS